MEEEPLAEELGSLSVNPPVLTCPETRASWEGPPQATRPLAFPPPLIHLIISGRKCGSGLGPQGPPLGSHRAGVWLVSGAGPAGSVFGERGDSCRCWCPGSGWSPLVLWEAAWSQGLLQRLGSSGHLSLSSRGLVLGPTGLTPCSAFKSLTELGGQDPGANERPTQSRGCRGLQGGLEPETRDQTPGVAS